MNGVGMNGYRKAVLALIVVLIAVLVLFCVTTDEPDDQTPAVEERASVACSLTEDVREKLGLSSFYEKSVAVDGIPGVDASVAAVQSSEVSLELSEVILISGDCVGRGSFLDGEIVEELTNMVVHDPSPRMANGGKSALILPEHYVLSRLHPRQFSTFLRAVRVFDAL